MRGVITIKRPFLVLFLVASLVSVGVAGLLYFHTTLSPSRVDVLFQIPSIEKHSSIVQVASNEIMLPVTGEYSIRIKGNAELYIQTASKLYKNPREVDVQKSRVVRVILLNQSTDVRVELRHTGAPDFRLLLLTLVIGGVIGLAVGMLKFE